MRTEQYVGLHPTWPNKGRHILARFDASSIHVYQAYRPAIADYAVKHQRFGSEFSYSRMSWIKPNFLWMMYRSGWALKEGQERILAIQLPRAFFDQLLQSAVASSLDRTLHSSVGEWKRQVANSDVRLQWDPDHDPFGRPLERRAIQLGLRGEALRRYGATELLSVTDITDFVAEQRAHVDGDLSLLRVPYEQAYRPASGTDTIGLDEVL